jgi:hypothetical protein
MRQAISRQGSFLLFSVALVAVMVAFGFALLQTVRLSADAGTSSQRQWFAQEAAIAGLHHAMENIALDYRSAHRSATYLDGIWHREFYPLGYDQNQPDSATPGADDDVRRENVLWLPIIERNDRGYWEYSNGYGSMGNNLYQYQGRARYYEVGYYEPADPTYASATRSNLSATRFTNAAAAVPSRAGGLFLDAQLHRIVPASGESVDAVRNRSRYRLRYAVITNDAGSALLVNPALDVDYRDAWKPGAVPLAAAPAMADDGTYLNAAYATYGAAFAPTELGRRMERYGNSLVNMLTAGSSPGERGACLRMEHVFKLRGVSSNLAVDDNGWPVAFPTMMRLWKSGSTCWAYHASDAPAATNLGLFKSPAGLIQLEGGQSVTERPANIDVSLAHALVGPQYSYRSIQTAISGDIDDADWGHGDPVQTRSLATPFGRAGEKGVKTAASQWNRGPTDVPWVINPLTASIGMLNGMIAGYMPSQFKKTPLRNMVTVGGVSTPTTAVTHVSASGRLNVTYGRDLFTDFMSPAFIRWPAQQGPPQTTAQDKVQTSPDVWKYPVPPYSNNAAHAPSLWPNYVIPDARPVSQVYPGPYASLSEMAPVDAMEDTGKDINASKVYCEGSSGYSRLCAFDSHSPNVLTGGPPLTYQNNWTETWVPMHGNLPIADSFFWDMSAAFGTALSVLRMHYVEVMNPWVNPANVFPNGRSPDADMDSIADLDALFLKQLGIDISNPASAAVTSSWKPLSIPASFPRKFGKDQVTLNNNIRSLVTGDLLKTATLTSVLRARSMEMMLNDWRMSFLGASPDYAATFRPLDFDGDGYAICSAYSASGSFADDVGGVTWPRRAADPNGQGPTVDPITDYPFSLTGCFTMTKSRYYRVIVRGELWDCQLRRPVSNATMESVLCIDANGRSTTNELNHDLAVLYQRWFWNSYNGLLPSIYP